MLRVAGLVEERAPVVGAADRLDHEHHAVRHLDRRAERPRGLVLALLHVELHVRLRAEVDAEIGERPSSAGSMAAAGNCASQFSARSRRLKSQ